MLSQRHEPMEASRGALAAGVRTAASSLVEGSRARFLTRPMAVLLGLYALAALTFASHRVANDGKVYLAFVQRLLGDDVEAGAGTTRQFGSALFNLPFYAAGWALEAIAGLDSALGAPLTHVAISVATIVAVGLTLWLGWRVLVALELPAGPAVLLLAIAGSPLFYYAVFQPSYKHAVDALFFTLLAYLLLRVSEGAATTPWLLGLGACLAVLVLIRSANVALVPGALLPLLLRGDRRGAALVISATAAAAALLVALPAARGIPLEERHQTALSAGLVIGDHLPFGLCEDEPVHVSFTQCLHNKVGLWWDPLAPAKMLVSVQRGMFLWTPLTALATLGFVLLARRRPDRRPFILGLGLAALGLLLVHVAWADFWTGGFSFSQRFLASLFPVFLLGTAELVRRWRGWAVAALSACALFSVIVGFTLFYGYEGVSERDGLDTILALYADGERSPWGLARTAGVHALERWGLR